MNSFYLEKNEMLKLGYLLMFYSYIKNIFLMYFFVMDFGIYLIGDD